MLLIVVYCLFIYLFWVYFILFLFGDVMIVKFGGFCIGFVNEFSVLIESFEICSGFSSIFCCVPLTLFVRTSPLWICPFMLKLF